MSQYFLWFWFSGMPGGEPVSDSNKGGSDPDLVPPIVLGVIFGVFIIVLLVSLYCFCRRKKGRYQGKGFLEKLLMSISTHFRSVFHYYTLWERQKTSGFLTFSGGIEMEHWTWYGLKILKQWLSFGQVHDTRTKTNSRSFRHILILSLLLNLNTFKTILSMLIWCFE